VTTLNPLQLPQAPVFSDGQQLEAADLQQISQFNTRMRQFHNLTLHGPGIASDMTVYGKKGENFVRVNAGIAIDYSGRELLIHQPLTLTVPQVLKGSTTPSAFFYLTISYADDQTAPIADDPSRSPTNRGYGALRLADEAATSWVPLKGPAGNLSPVDLSVTQELTALKRLVLALVEIRDCKIQSVNQNVRRLARPRSAPYLFGGRETIDFKQTESGETTRRIDTGSAGFLSVPIYLVQLQPSFGSEDQQTVNEMVGSATVNIADSRPDGFRAVISLSTDGAQRRGLEIRNNNFTFDIVWIGIEGEL
jgi:hypothetical protein